MKSLSTRLAVVISSILLALMLLVGVLLDRELSSAIRQADIEQVEVHARTLLGSLKTLMLNGSGTLAREWLDRLHGVAGIVEIEVLRGDGSVAFTDLNTVHKVNRFLGENRFKREPEPPRGNTASAVALQKAQNRRVSIDLSNPDRVSLFVPIETDVECMACHGYDPSPLRGVLHLSVSSDVSQERIGAMRIQLWVSAAVLVALLAMVLWMSVRFSVLQPVARLRDAITKVGQGERAAMLPVVRGDELGEVATVFNQMQKALRMSETRTKLVMDNVVDGILTVQEDGTIESANPSVERIFGYKVDELIGQNAGVLTPEPYRDGPESFLNGGTSTLGVAREIHGRRKNGTVFPMDVAISETRVGGRCLYICIVRDITSRKAQTAALKYQAMHDALTDLPNRALLYDRLQQCIRAAQRDTKSVALIIMDLDRFKEVNDTLGHQVGDKLLQQVAQRLRLVLRESDTVARLGGDEFSVLLPGAEAAQAAHTALKIIKALEQPFFVDSQHLEVGASVGISLFPLHGQDGVVLMKRADVAMYVAKRGRKGYVIYDPEQDQHSMRQLAITTELRAALEKDQLILHYQPKVDIKRGRVEGVEALVRWQHPLHGLMSPDEFIPLAEQAGLIKPLTLWVLRKALTQCSPLIKKSGRLTLSVNLSMRDLHDAQFADEVAAILSASGLAADCLKLEITETALMAEPERAMEAMYRLHGMGVGLSIDDFGTGYSSLAYLKQMPVDELKIDKSFVMSLIKDDNSVVIVRSTIEMAHKLGLRVIAKGVENDAVYGVLGKLGCDAVQGVFTGRPMAVDDIPRWISNRGWAKQWEKLQDFETVD